MEKTTNDKVYKHGLVVNFFMKKKKGYKTMLRRYERNFENGKDIKILY